jgi:hypothetical protein
LTLTKVENAAIRIVVLLVSIVIGYFVAVWVNGVLLNANVSTQDAGWGEVGAFFLIVLIANGLIYVYIRK